MSASSEHSSGQRAARLVELCVTRPDGERSAIMHDNTTRLRFDLGDVFDIFLCIFADTDPPIGLAMLSAAICRRQENDRRGTLRSMSVRFREAVLVLCDRVRREMGSGKPILDGVFDQITVASYPGGINCSLWVKCYLKDPTVTSVPLRLSLERPSGTTEPFPEVPIAVKEGRLEIDVNLHPLPLLHGGWHRILLLDGVEIAASASFLVAEAQNVKPGAN